MTLTIDDRAFRAGLEARMANLKQTLRAGVRGYGNAAVLLARSHIHDVSGELSGSLGIQDHLDESPPYLLVGAFETEEAKLQHAVETEFGSSKETARPYMRPGLEEAKRDYHVDP